ncbi:uncharacterized protein LOC108330432 [Vigna angularis]|uniref:uncharacterized protein LOC108330432 n=1 Tax=Phaseolus angularis TaxID=3914 RepID=UPI0022B44595|nr:uncharacterized protein LOC108330432 [Vigna angularis]
MSMDDPAEMMRVLQQKMDEMQQRHEEEMAAVKADCEARIAREMGRLDKGERVKDKGKGVEGERPPPDTEGDKTWRPSGSEAEESKVKSVQAESAAEDGRMIVKSELSSTLLLPFTQNIMNVQISEQFMAPQFKMYNRATHPASHIQTFSNAMAFRTGNDAIWCRAFSLSLEDEALEWFNTLPPNSIENFTGLKQLFIKQFAASSTQDLTVFELMTLKQGKDETLRTFMDRYQKTVRRVKSLTPELALHYVLPALKLGPFKDSVCRRAPKTMEELRERAADEIRVEEMKLSYKKENQEVRGERTDGSKTGSSMRKTFGLRPGDQKKGPRFQQYTPLNASREKILREALSAELITEHEGLPTSKNADRSKHCSYHKNMGHSTEDCWTLKDKIEELIRAGKLKKYVRDERPPQPTERPTQRPAYRKDKPRNPKAERPRQERRPSRSRSRSRERPLRGHINTIFGGFAGGGSSSSARKRHIRALHSVHLVDKPRRSLPPITFSDEDFHAPDPDQDDPMVITAEIERYGISKVLVDRGSSVNILYWKTFQQMDTSEDLIVPYDGQIVGFAGERVDTRGYVELRTRLGTGRSSEEKRVWYLLVEANTSYNVLLGRPCLNAFGAIVSTPHLTMKYPSEKGTICTVRADQKTARECYAAGLKLHVRLQKRRAVGSEVAMADLDPRTNTEDRLEPIGETQPILIGRESDQTTLIARGLNPEMEKELRALLWENRDLFAWTAADMPGIHPAIMSHKLSLFQNARPIAQKKRRMGEEKRKAVEEEMEKLRRAGFVRAVTYTTWLASVVMVKKASGKWRMCTDYTDLNKACPKDSHPLPSIDALVDGASGHRVLSFLDAYSGYNQIPMYGPDIEKTAFITEKANFCYEVMPFGLKNAGATYQRLMDRIFRDQIGRCMDVYVDDMVVRSADGEGHLKDLEEVFRQVRKFGMRLKPAKCTFGVTAGKFLGFMLTSRGIEANPDKCDAVLQMQSPTTLKEVQRLVGRLTALSRFIPKLAERMRPVLRKLKKGTGPTWDDECERAFQDVKTLLSNPPVMSRPVPGGDLHIFLGVSKTAVSAVLMQERAQARLVYFVSRTLLDAETRYQRVEKVALALLHASRRLRPYFQSYQVIVRTDFPISKILRKPDLAGRMVAWAIELSEFGLRYEPRGSVKGQHLADFAAELPPSGQDDWNLYVDGASGRSISGADIVLEGPNGFLLEHSLIFKFKVSNNQAEYEALVAGLELAKDMGARRITCRTDSELVVGQMNGNFQVREERLLRYYQRATELAKAFDKVDIQHIPREQNTRADVLSKLSSGREKGQLTTVVRQVLLQPSVECASVSSGVQDWRAGIREIMNRQDEGRMVGPGEAKRVARYLIVGDDLYRRGFSSPLLKCLGAEEAYYVMDELHNGVCGLHTGWRTLKARLLRAGYYWPTMEADTRAFVQKCVPCQEHSNNPHLPPHALHSISSPWPFAQWGMDIVGPFPAGRAQKKFLLVAVDYFTKWVEVEPLATITAAQVQKFCWKLICRFGLPQSIITDNG